MKFFEDITVQVNKRQNPVCGDFCLCEKTLIHTLFVLCDGIGSGVYANVSAVYCANRLMELFRSGVSQREAVEMVAESMHRVRSEEIPFAAFSMVKILNDGQFTVYGYEAPSPVIIENGVARPLPQHFYTVGYESVAESNGSLQLGDTLVICSDGVTQAGLGRGSFGIGSEGLASYINRNLHQIPDLHRLGRGITEMTAAVSGGVYADDTTVTLLNCRRAKELAVFTGPPADKNKDSRLAERFLAAQGQAVICGSSTADIISRETKREIRMSNMNNLSFDSPPEYNMEGAKMVTEGAIMLNQLYNILDENPRDFVDKTPAERLCLLMHEADVITFIVGDALNEAHGNMMFKQVGVRPRHTMIRLLTERLRAMGKLVVEEKL